MNAISTENFLVEEISISTESNKINTKAVQYVTFHKSKELEWSVVI
jgi:superfamily I DNA/RNA helicase